jgi:hypothetical protein
MRFRSERLASRPNPATHTSALQGAFRWGQTGPLGPGAAATILMMETSVADIIAVAATPEAKAIRLLFSEAP